MEKDPCRGVVYLTVLRDHPYLVSLLFHSAIPTSCYIFDVLYWLVPNCAKLCQTCIVI